MSESQDGAGGRRRPDQQLYRPGMFKRGIDLTQTAPRPENQPPPSERRLQQRRQERESRVPGERNQSHGPIFSQRNAQQYRSLPPGGRDRRQFEFTGHGRPMRGGRPRDNDSRSVRSGRYGQPVRGHRNRPVFDSRSEMGNPHADDTESLASTTFSNDTTCYNGFASELNSRNPSIQSLLSQDPLSFDWAECVTNDERTGSQLEKLPETDSNGNQEDDLSSERTETSTPRKLSSDRRSVIEQAPSSSSADLVETKPVLDDEVDQLVRKIEDLNEFKENDEGAVRPSVASRRKPTHSPSRVLTSTGQHVFEQATAPEAELVVDGEFQLHKPIIAAMNSLNQLQTRLQSLLHQSELPEVPEEQLSTYFSDCLNDFSHSLQRVVESKEQCVTEAGDEFRKCAIEVMKVQKFAEKAVSMLAVRKHKFILTVVTDITLKALSVVATLLLYHLEGARKFQMIEAFEAIWQKLVSQVKKHVIVFGKHVAIQLITLVRGCISALSGHLGVDQEFGEFAKSLSAAEFKDLSQPIVIKTDLVSIPQHLFVLASNVYRWHGDLVRYQSMILGSVDYDPSLKLYFLSFIMDPSSGTAVNQMGAVASFKEPSDLLNAVFCFCHALTTAKPFSGCDTKLLTLLASPFESGHDTDANTARLAFIQNFLEVARITFVGEDVDLQLAVDKVMANFKLVFDTEDEMVVFTTSDLVFQIGILWKLINMDRIQNELKDLLKQMLVGYMEIMCVSLVRVDLLRDSQEQYTKIAFLLPALSLLINLWPFIGGGHLNLNVSPVFDYARFFDEAETVFNILLPELLLILHGDKNLLDLPSNEKFFLRSAPVQVAPVRAGTFLRLLNVCQFFRAYSSFTLPYGL